MFQKPKKKLKKMRNKRFVLKLPDIRIEFCIWKRVASLKM